MIARPHRSLLAIRVPLSIPIPRVLLALVRIARVVVPVAFTLVAVAVVAGTVRCVLRRVRVLLAVRMLVLVLVRVLVPLRPLARIVLLVETVRRRARGRRAGSPTCGRDRGVRAEACARGAHTFTRASAGSRAGSPEGGQVGRGEGGRGTHHSAVDTARATHGGRGLDPGARRRERATSWR